MRESLQGANCGLLGPRLCKLGQQLGGSKVLVLPEIPDGLDVERMLQQVRVAFADSLKRADRRLKEARPRPLAAITLGQAAQS
ncbi:MAG: hypothetical protein ACJ72K_07365 [Friedmanniella sp.]